MWITIATKSYTASAPSASSFNGTAQVITATVRKGTLERNAIMLLPEVLDCTHAEFTPKQEY
jgi:hypothetical protein